MFAKTISFFLFSFQRLILALGVAALGESISLMLVSKKFNIAGVV